MEKLNAISQPHLTVHSRSFLIFLSQENHDAYSASPTWERLLAHTDLRAIQWVNIARPVVRFKTILK
jgi:hypothetical protein